MEHQSATSTQSASLKEKTIAVGSGKGGVGKSTVALHIALTAARTGLRVALVDLDPLSNIAVILDVRDGVTEYAAEELQTPAGSLSDYAVEAAPRVRLLFPGSKRRKGESELLRRLLFDHFARELDSSYDLVVCDLPAGINRDENLAFLPYAKRVVVVVQPEPTSHVSAGGFIRAATEISPTIEVLLWHNKYSSDPSSGFDSRNVIGNYNSYVSEDMQVPSDVAGRIRDIAFVPSEPALNLLLSSMSPQVVLLQRTRSVLDLLAERAFPAFPSALRLSERTEGMVRHYLAAHEDYSSSEETTSAVEDYLRGVAGRIAHVRSGAGTSHGREKYGSAARAAVSTDPAMPVLSGTQRRALEAYIPVARKSMLAGRVKRARTAAQRYLENFADRKEGSSRLEEQLLLVVKDALRSPRWQDPAVRNGTGILLLYVSLFKLLHHPQIGALITGAVPTRADESGKRVRDRGAQIRALIAKENAQHQAFYQLVRRIYPAVVRQLLRLSERAGISRALLRHSGREINRSAYLKLLTSWLHDALYSGLGVATGIAHTPAAAAMGRGAHALLSRVGEAKENLPA